LEILNPLHHKEAADLKVGEVVRPTFVNGPALAIVLDIQNAVITYGVLVGSGFKGPTVHAHGQDDAVLSYGTETIFEVVPSNKTGYVKRSTPALPGEAIISGGRLLIGFSNKDRGPHRIAYFEVGTFAKAQSPQSEAHGLTWSLWASKAERDRPGANAIYKWSRPETATSSRVADVV
jgi:hypothetical protein